MYFCKFFFAISFELVNFLERQDVEELTSLILFIILQELAWPVSIRRFWETWKLCCHLSKFALLIELLKERKDSLLVIITLTELLVYLIYERFKDDLEKLTNKNIDIYSYERVLVIT